jgi:ABC-type multidrug transport system ATPase subunit
MTDPDELVEVENVRYRYRSARAPALQDVSLRVERGVVLGLVGPNGSGKTTLYRLVLGFISPHGGRVRIGSLAPQAYRTRRGIGYLPEQVRLPGNVRVYELARLIGRLAGLERVELNDSLERSMSVLALDGQADAMVGTLSHGYRQRVGLLAAMLGDPELLLFDEPANGLDPASVGILRSVLRDLKRRGRTVIVSSHNLSELERVCDEVLILSHGSVLGRSTRDELAGQPDVWVAQLGPETALRSELDALRRGYGGVRLAADETAFADEGIALRFADAVRFEGGTVEAIERRPFDLECLFHSLTDDADRI